MQFNEREILQGAGKISKKQAEQKALEEYVRFQAAKRIIKEQQGEDDIAELVELSKN